MKRVRFDKESLLGSLDRFMRRKSLRTQYSIVIMALSVLTALSIVSIIWPFI